MVQYSAPSQATLLHWSPLTAHKYNLKAYNRFTQVQKRGWSTTSAENANRGRNVSTQQLLTENVPQQHQHQGTQKNSPESHVQQSTHVRCRRCRRCRRTMGGDRVGERSGLPRSTTERRGVVTAHLRCSLWWWQLSRSSQAVFKRQSHDRKRRVGENNQNFLSIFKLRTDRSVLSQPHRWRLLLSASSCSSPSLCFSSRSFCRMSSEAFVCTKRR